MRKPLTAKQKGKKAPYDALSVRNKKAELSDPGVPLNLNHSETVSSDSEIEHSQLMHFVELIRGRF